MQDIISNNDIEKVYNYQGRLKLLSMILNGINIYYNLMIIL